MLDFIINQTMDFLETMPKLTRKKKRSVFYFKGNGRLHGVSL